MFQGAKAWLSKIKATRLIIGEKLELKAETIKVAGAVSVSTPLTILDATAGSCALTLADGYQGQVKTIIMMTAGGTMTMTPSHLGAYGGAKTTVAFDAVGKTWVGIFYGSQWYTIGTATATVG